MPNNNITRELKTALKALRELDAGEFNAIVLWLRGNGRESLRKQGADDQAIGPARFDVDCFDDAPIG